VIFSDIFFPRFAQEKVGRDGRNQIMQRDARGIHEAPRRSKKRAQVDRPVARNTGIGERHA
jgi:hypothetical protein